ncbi:MAG: glycosyltransferase family 4 protein [Patescibacteria group bacterium]
MRLLLIGMDRTVFKEGSATRERIARLGREVERLDVIIFSTRAHQIADRQELVPGVHVYPTNSYSRLLYGWDALRIALRLPRPDIVSTQDPFEIGLAGLLFSWLSKVPLAVEMHTDFLSHSFAQHSFLNRIRVLLARFVVQGAAGGYAVSERLQDKIMRAWAPAKEIGVVPIYVDTKTYSSIARTKHLRFRNTLLWVGRFEAEKNPQVALEALAFARAKGHDAGLVMVGNGRLEGLLRQQAQDLGVTEWVEFAGYQSDVRPYYAYADVLLVTSSYEGYGMVIVEALSAEVPVLSTNVGIAREAGALVVKGDFPTALLLWLSGPRERGKLLMPTYKDADEYYRKVVRCYEAILDSKKVRRLLILTQTVDLDEPLLGFFHQWIIALSSQYDSLEVICLKEGRHNLPENVRVHSLGKESGQSRFKYVWRFFMYIWSLRNRYDSVFVHMNQEYVLLGGLFWRALGKHAYLWRNYHHGTFLTRIAMHLAKGAFCTSESSYTARFKKTKIMPIGVDTSRFGNAQSLRARSSILSLGRVTPDKRLDVLVNALYELSRDEVSFKASIYGNASEGSAYASVIKGLVEQYGMKERVSFSPGVPNHETPEIYAAHELFVNTSPSGMYDKTLIEAAAAGCLVLTSIHDFKDAAGEDFWFDGTAPGLAAGMRRLLSASDEQKAAWQERLGVTAASHSLGQLVGRLTTEIQ